MQILSAINENQLPRNQHTQRWHRADGILSGEKRECLEQLLTDDFLRGERRFVGDGAVTTFAASPSSLFSGDAGDSLSDEYGERGAAILRSVASWWPRSGVPFWLYEKKSSRSTNSKTATRREGKKESFVPLVYISQMICAVPTMPYVIATCRPLIDPPFMWNIADFASSTDAKCSSTPPTSRATWSSRSPKYSKRETRRGHRLRRRRRAPAFAAKRTNNLEPPSQTFKWPFHSQWLQRRRCLAALPLAVPNARGVVHSSAGVSVSRAPFVVLHSLQLSSSWMRGSTKRFDIRKLRKKRGRQTSKRLAIWADKSVGVCYVEKTHPWDGAPHVASPL
jgi:hypothetical protein